MADRLRLDREYVLDGVVRDRTTRRGVSGVVVEAWDRDTQYHDMLGQATTDLDGRFVIAFDSAYFGNAAPDHGADVFFRLYLDDREVLTTFDRPLHNLQKGTRAITLEIDLPQVPSGKDRVTTEQAIKAVDWWRASDFRGVAMQGSDKARTVSRMLGALVGDSFRSFDFAPVQPRGTREREVVNQPADAARVALIQQHVEVSEVKPVSTLDARAKLRTLAAYPLALKAGDRVTLYDENGVVRYYTRDAAPAATADQETVTRIDDDLQAIKTQVAGIVELRTEVENARTAAAEVAARATEEQARTAAQAKTLERLQAQLDEVQRVSAAKDAQIAKLQSDLSLVTKAQDTLAARLSSSGSGTVDRPSPTPRKKRG
jgi:hypothetical protein